MLGTQSCVSEWLQLLSVPCYMEGGDAALRVLASYWLGPCWFLQGIPVARDHLWAADWCEAAQGHWATAALCDSKRTYSLSLWATFGWHSAQEVHPAEGEWLESTDNFGNIHSTSFLSSVCWDLQRLVFLKGTQQFHGIDSCLLVLSTLDACVLPGSVSWAVPGIFYLLPCLPRYCGVYASAKLLRQFSAQPQAEASGQCTQLLQEFSQGKRCWTPLREG